MQVHSAIFKQPGPELNPLGAKVPTPISVEVFQILAGKLQRPQGWTAREKTTQTLFKMAGVQQSPYEARYRVAKLFARQISPWVIDGEQENVSASHLHYQVNEPSLCGTRFHQERQDVDLTVSLPDVRAGRLVLLRNHWEILCKKCQELIDRTPAPGDRVRVRVSGKLAYVIASQNPNAKAGEIERYILRYDEPASLTDPIAWTAAELGLVMFETRPQF